MRVAYGRGPVLLWWRCDTLCTSGFVNDVESARLQARATRVERLLKTGS